MGSIAAGSTSCWRATGRRAGGPRAAFQAAAVVSGGDQRRSRGGDPEAARAAGERRSRRRRAHDRCAPRSRAPRGSFCLDDLAGPQAPRADRGPAAEAPALLADPLRSRSTKRDVAGRRHRLAARRRFGGRDPQPDRRPLKAFPGSDAYQRVKAADVVASFHKAAQLHGLPHSLLSDNGAVFTGSYRKARCSWSPSSSASACSSRTHAPTTPRPAGRSRGSTRHSSAT